MWRRGFWRSWPGTAVLAGALGAHVAFTLGKFVQRRSLHMPAWEGLQIGMGLAIPLLLLPHIYPLETYTPALRNILSFSFL